jgi:hypothetical protein
VLGAPSSARTMRARCGAGSSCAASRSKEATSPHDPDSSAPAWASAKCGARCIMQGGSWAGMPEAEHCTQRPARGAAGIGAQ